MIDKSNWRYSKITRDTAEKYEAPTGEVTYFLSTAAETDGKVTVFDAYFPKGSGVPLHIHKLDEELFLVTSGKYKVAVADEEFELGPGEMAIAGIDVPRMFEAITDDAWIIVMTSPAGPAENFIRYMQNLQGPPSEEDIQYVAKEYGVVFGGAL
jgi:quercetin dioxygenase-like cupin family protein